MYTGLLCVAMFMSFCDDYWVWVANIPHNLAINAATAADLSLIYSEHHKPHFNRVLQFYCIFDKP